MINESNVILSIFFSLLTLLFFAVTFLLIQFWFIISWFQNNEKLILDIQNTKNLFLIFRLNKLKNLSAKKIIFKSVFYYFYSEYKRLFEEEINKNLNDLIKFLDEKKNIKNRIQNKREESQIYSNFETMHRNIKELSGNIYFIFAWEKFCLEKVNSFYLIFEKIEEELNDSESSISFDYREVRKKIQSFRERISLIEKSIENLNYEKTFLSLQIFLKETKSFVFYVVEWLKFVFFYRKILPQKIENFAKFISKKNIEISSKWTENQNKFLETKMLFFYQRLKNFNSQERFIEDEMIEIFLKIASLREQIENFAELKSVFLNSLSVAEELFESTSQLFSSFERRLKTFGKSFIFFHYKGIEFEKWRKKFFETKELINDMIIEKYEIEKVVFFYPLIIKMIKVFENIEWMASSLKKINDFLVLQQIKNENFYLLINNILSILQKDKNLYLKEIFWPDFQKILANFTKLKRKMIEESAQKIYLEKLANLYLTIEMLKSSILNKIVLRNIAEYLLIHGNMIRFKNNYFSNKILNSEILFAQKKYKLVIESMIDFLDEKEQRWSIND